MKRFLIITLSLILVFQLFVVNFASAAQAPEMIKGAYVKSTFEDYRVRVVVEDFYLDVPEARQFASKMEASINEAYIWIAVALMPKVGPFLGTIGALSIVDRQRVANDIRKFTDQNRKVHIRKTRCQITGVVGHTISQWDGKRSSVAPSIIHPNQQLLVIIYHEYPRGGWDPWQPIPNSVEDDNL